MYGNKILAVETSCDETSAAIVADGRYVLSNIISSQINVHQKFGGVVPEIASRKHVEAIVPVVNQAFSEASCGFNEIDGVAVTYGPGLVGALLVGLSFGKAAAYALEVPLIGINHLVGHLYAGFLEAPDVEFPLIALVVSGGHTSIIYVPNHGYFTVLGETRDDAAGEVLDKVARAMGLGYPGGPEIEKKAALGNPQKYEFPRAWLEKNSLDFSFSGLKSALLNFLHNAEQRNEKLSVNDVAACFQEAVIDVLVEKTALGAVKNNVKTVMMVGGVASNKRLRLRMRERLDAEGVRLVVPPPELCTDNAAMIGCAAYYKMHSGRFSDLFLNAVPNLGLDVENYQ
ncbi:MAG: tRNA (adenosine(37)-N6)-threonylcarbamoyltransferase complex transferase subunit TsaD [Bacillota bacterium]